MPTPSFPSVSFLCKAVLKTRAGEEILGKTLWQQGPVVLMLVRRPGCVLCRYQAGELWSNLKSTLDQLGVRLACIVHEWRDREIEAFSPRYWPGDVYFDVNKEFFKTLGSGKLVKGSVLPLLNPFSSVWKRISEAKTKVPEFNVVGDGLTMGGVMVIGGKADKPGLVYMHVEKDIGRPAPLQEVLAAAMQAADPLFRTGSGSLNATHISSGTLPKLDPDLVRQSVSILQVGSPRADNKRPDCVGLECR